jgi:hypothetical protein
VFVKKNILAKFVTFAFVTVMFQIRFWQNAKVHDKFVTFCQITGAVVILLQYRNVPDMDDTLFGISGAFIRLKQFWNVDTKLVVVVGSVGIEVNDEHH